MNVVLLGGNGYIGRAVTKEWLQKDPKANFYIVSRSGANKLNNPRIHNLKVSDLSMDIVNQIPEEIDYIVDFVGRPEKDADQLKQINIEPAKIMKAIAEEKQVKAMGFVGGVLGPKSFTSIKKEIISMLKGSSIPVKYVEPTLVYGADRNDALSKMVPIFKFLGLFSGSLKPVKVEEVASSLVTQLLTK
ncbi:NAD-dependent epimerase/dehydratase family protein [Paenibacillus segetis]|uniref:UDP-glucose 4-epimerase n=1 Tax=Paenibacillus segetis TaxID=1325360 RepID=A0ABQ1YCJ7_9BACL|nr:NAD-dependent epimerase/dehydratase family protein [Paenibacillus segetis]GGH20766.1 UDP-glucose 4-epimerase [Paenibacillus segetis]